jgi:hypothetical protein
MGFWPDVHFSFVKENVQIKISMMYYQIAKISKSNLLMIKFINNSGWYIIYSVR